jgi:hypothetical protein
VDCTEEVLRAAVHECQLLLGTSNTNVSQRGTPKRRQAIKGFQELSRQAHPNLYIVALRMSEDNQSTNARATAEALLPAMLGFLAENCRPTMDATFTSEPSSQASQLCLSTASTVPINTRNTSLGKREIVFDDDSDTSQSNECA